jgi:hypothetical protein
MKSACLAVVVFIGLVPFLQGLEIHPDLAGRAKALAAQPGQVAIETPTLGRIKVVGSSVFIQPKGADTWFFWGMGHGVAASSNYPGAFYLFLATSESSGTVYLASVDGSSLDALWENVESTGPFLVLEDEEAVVSVEAPTGLAYGGKYSVRLYGKGSPQLRTGVLLLEGKQFVSIEAHKNDEGAVDRILVQNSIKGPQEVAVTDALLGK